MTSTKDGRTFLKTIFSLTDEGSDDAVVLDVPALVGVGDLEHDRRVHLHAQVHRRGHDDRNSCLSAQNRLKTIPNGRQKTNFIPLRKKRGFHNSRQIFRFGLLHSLDMIPL